MGSAPHRHLVWARLSSSVLQGTANFGWSGDIPNSRGTHEKENDMAWLGMNDDEVNAQGNVLQHQAEAIQKLISKVDSEVESLKANWQGDDSKQFEQEWTGTHRPELQKAQKLLTDMKSTIDREVSQQRSTSSQY